MKFPKNIETVKRLCQRITEEQDPQSFSSLVHELNLALIQVLIEEEEEDLNRQQKQGWN